MNTALLLFALLALTNAEPPIPRHYQTQKKLRSPPKVNSYQPVDSPTTFGFVPVKTAENYAQKEPLGRYVYPDLLRQTQAYATGKYSQYQTQAQYTPQATQYSQYQQQSLSGHPQQQQGYTQHQLQALRGYSQQQQAVAGYSQQQQAVTGYSQPTETQQAVTGYSQPTEQTVQQYVSPHQYVQQYVQPAQEYVYQQPQLYYQPDVKNVNYIADNHVPQYVYVQQTPEPSNTVENVVVPKDQEVRYIMLIPTYVPQQTEVPSYYVTKQSGEQNLVAETAPADLQQQQYVYNTIDSGKIGYKKEPTSLLDSYIPSVLQLQYYKKLAQAQNNEISDSTKALSLSGKKKKRDV